MDIPEIIVAITGLFTALNIGVTAYNRKQMADFKRWVCFRVPCLDRLKNVTNPKN